MAQFQGKTAMITGGAAGIGREIAHRFASEGARVVIVDWNEAENEKTAGDLHSKGAICQAVTADVSSPADVQRAFEIAGPMDILVNNASFSQGDGFLLDVSEEVWDKTLAVCLKSVFLCSKAALRGMVERSAGVIINISSVNALTGIHLASYTAAKAGIISLTRVLAAQYGGLGVRINTICPGTILSESSRAYYEAHPEIASGLTALYPARKFGTTSDIASAALFLASDEATFINGTVLTVDGGLSAVHQITGTSKLINS